MYVRPYHTEKIFVIADGERVDTASKGGAGIDGGDNGMVSKTRYTITGEFARERTGRHTESVTRALLRYAHATPRANKRPRRGSSGGAFFSSRYVKNI